MLGKCLFTIADHLCGLIHICIKVLADDIVRRCVDNVNFHSVSSHCHGNAYGGHHGPKSNCGKPILFVDVIQGCT